MIISQARATTPTQRIALLKKKSTIEKQKNERHIFDRPPPIKRVLGEEEKAKEKEGMNALQNGKGGKRLHWHHLGLYVPPLSPKAHSERQKLDTTTNTPLNNKTQHSKKGGETATLQFAWGELSRLSFGAPHLVANYLRRQTKKSFSALFPTTSHIFFP
eukprot:PhM_4_TR17333/c0_g1_i2/m.85314